jgi:phosphinothricin acetyltransferase
MPLRTGDGLRIRDAAPGDMAAVAAIYAPEVRSGTATFETEPPDAAEMAARLAAVTAAGYPWLVAHRDGAIAGYAYAGPFRTRPAFRFTVENSIYVAEAARGHGVGRALLEHLIGHCTARGFRQMVAVIGDSANQKSSLRLHAGLGFVEVGRLPDVGFKHGRWLDTVLMQRPLGEGGAPPPASR